MVHIKEITFSYRRSGANILEQVSFDVADRQCVGVLGNNGTGKSTLLKCIDRIYRTRGASVLIDGKDILQIPAKDLARLVAYVPQNARAVDSTVFEAVLLGRKPYIRWDASEHDYAVTREVIREMGLESFSLRNVSELSGGEAQKVMLARALAQQPRLLLLDEPTSNLDPRNQHEVFRTVKTAAQQHGISVIVVIHDLNLAVRYCDKFLFLKDSRVYSFGGPETVSPETIRDIYGIPAEIIEHAGQRLVVPA